MCVLRVFFFEGYGDHRDLHVLTHSFPTRRSSDLCSPLTVAGAAAASRTLCGARSAFPLNPRVGEPSTLRLSVRAVGVSRRSEEHTSELQSLMRISYAVFCLKKNNIQHKQPLQHRPNPQTTTTQLIRTCMLH